MTPKILLTYATNSGSTGEVAEAIQDEVAKDGTPVELRPVKEVQSLEGDTAVVLGAPVIAGWHRDAMRFLKQHKAALARLPIDGVPVTIDPDLPKEPKQPGKLSFRENYATPSNYLRPLLKAASGVTPVSAAFFAGKLELFRLNIFQMIFATLVTGGRAGDFRNWEAIGRWAVGLHTVLVRSEG